MEARNTIFPNSIENRVRHDEKTLFEIIMILTFRINYRTLWGEHLAVEIKGEKLGAIPLTTTDGDLWEGSVHLPKRHAGEIVEYHYSVWEGTRCVRRECELHPHLMHPESQTDDLYVLNDHWRDLPFAGYLFTSAFSGSYPAVGRGTPSLAASTLTVRVLCPTLRHKGQVPAMVGASEVLGNWNPDKALRLEEVMPDKWLLTLDVHRLCGDMEYKFVALDATTGECREWEGGENRRLQVPELDRGVHYFLPETEVYFPSTGNRMSGTAIPVFSLRSEGSQGVGDFGDLKKMVDWVVLTRQRALQVLPINDTTHSGTRQDSYPYNAISIYALHPMYVDLRQVERLNDPVKQAEFDKQFRQLNALPELDYERVNKLKRDYLLLVFRQNGKEVLESQGFKSFLSTNLHWLRPYAAFSYLRDKYATPVFEHWPQHSVYDADVVSALCSPDGAAWEKVAYYFYVQYLLHLQLLAVSRHARANGVILKGDIPIGISRHSVEAWVEPHYFNMNGQAGAPPDAFATNGQNWGFPTYNWDVMRQDGYRWWKRRFSKMAEYFTAYRIDHILGFFRIWEIPSHAVQGLLGQFSPALPMSEEEIRSYGLNFQKDFMARPFVNDDILHRIFGDRDEWVKQTFLLHSHYDVWTFRPEYSTQRSIEAYFKKEGSRRHVGSNDVIRDGLYELMANVLFVEDHKQRGTYHPRIGGSQTLVFERLQPVEKEAFRRIHQHFFYERHNRFWYDSAMQKLPTLCAATAMLPCGEDLGMVPECVSWVMDELQIFSLEIERMPKSPHHDFGHVEAYPFRSVCTIGTHDMATVRGWWKEDKRQISRYYHSVLHRGGELPAEATGRICEDIVRRHLESPSALCILALQDWLAIDEQLRLPDADAERINIPADPHHEWQYRMHLTLESLMCQTAFNQRIVALSKAGGRA